MENLINNTLTISNSVLEFLISVMPVYLIGVPIYLTVYSFMLGYTGKQWEFKDLLDQLFYPLSMLNGLGSLVRIFIETKKYKLEQSENATPFKAPSVPLKNS